MGKKSSKTVNQERPISQQELRLLETQNEQMKRGIAVAENQENRSQEQYDQYKRDFLPDMTMNGAVGGKEDAMLMMDNQMPDYAEDTSGARDSTFGNQSQQGQPQQAQVGRGGGAKGGSRGAKGGRNG